MLRQKFFAFLAWCATTSIGWWVLGFCALLTVVSAFLIPRLPILTTREGMVDVKLEAQKRYLEFVDDFGTQNQLIALVEGDPLATRAAAKDLAEALAKDPNWVKNVFYRVNIENLKRSGLYYLPLPTVEKTADGIKKYQPLMARALADGTWTGALGMVESELLKITPTNIADKKAMADGFAIANRFVDKWQEFLEKSAPPAMTFDELALGEAAASMSDSTADSEGYLIGDQGRIKILFVQQSKNIDNTEYIVPFMRYCRDTAAQVMQKHPGVTVGFTGWPVAIEEEIGLIRRDLNRVSWIATAVIFLLVWFAFRSIHRTLLMFIPVAVSIVWNFGITLFTIGHLNYLTSAFVGILFGLGIDYGVVFIRRFDEEIGAGRTPAEAITNTLMNVGQSVANGAATTIAAFFAIGFTDQPAFNELGIVAGTGIICAILATFFVMPALMYRFPPKQKPGETDRLTESKLLRAAAQKMLPGAKWVALGLLALLVLAAAQIPRLRFDYNLNNLLPADSETVRVTARLESATKYKAQYVSVVADNLEQTRRLHELLEKLPSVARVESMALLIPSEQAEKQRLFPDIEAALNGVTIKTKAGPPDIKALRARLTTLNQRLQAAQEDAFAAGLKDLVAHLDNFLVRLETINQLLDRPEAAARQAAFETAFFGELAKAKTEFLRMLNADPITLDNLDPAMKERFQGRSGRLATMVFPKEQIWDVKFLDEFVGEIEKAAAGVLGPDKLVERITGFGVVYRTTTRMIHHGFQQASIVAAIAVFLLVLIDFRKLRAVFLTLVPLGSAILLSLGVLAVTGRQLNMANQLYLPILLGIGIDYGILMTHRWLEPDGVDLPRVVATMGNALWLAAGTAMTGFGALLFAHHQGMMSFGGTLTMAVAITMLVAIFGHPMVIKALGLDPRNKSARARK